MSVLEDTAPTNPKQMYKFYKVFANGKEKYCDTFNSTLDPNYHAYINWCRENGIGWKLVDGSGKIKFSNN